MTFPVQEIKDMSVPSESIFTLVLPTDRAIPGRDIVMVLRQRGETVSSLARIFGCQRDVLARVIHRQEPYVYPEVREQLASWLGVSEWQVGRDGTAHDAPAE